MIAMAGIDYKLAPLEVRESFSFTDETLTSAYDHLKTMPDILGAVIISTCNRTELYLAAEMDSDPFGLLCSLAGADAGAYPHYSLTGNGVTRHLCALASGAISQIWGEEQILTQVKASIASAREHGASCNVLEVLFRESVTAAKRIKSEIRLGARENSIVYKALDAIRTHGGIKRVLVIGNGEIGRLTVSTLIENGYDASMTLRTYRHGETLIPAGAGTIPYDERYSRLGEYDALVSATRSPHHTIDASLVRRLPEYPSLWLDLAVPRDIDPEVVSLPGVTYYNVDSLGAGEAWEGREEKLRQAEGIIEEHIASFEKWLAYRSELDSASGKNEYFPLFISSRGKKALLVGGGKIAARRAAALMRFEFDVTVVAPDALDELVRMHSRGWLSLIRRGFEDADLDGQYLVVAATDDRELNRRIGCLAAERGILASIADSREECSFLFPAIAVSGDIVAGLSSGGKSHRAVAEAAKRVREVL